MQKETKTASCPGTSTKKVVIARGTAAQLGFGHPKNIGTCTLFIACLDSSGNVIDETNNLKLEPGDEIDWFYPKTGTVSIVFACSKDCNGTAVLEYDAFVS